MSDESRAREEICRVGASLFARGYVHATAGNISMRLADGYLITPTDACLGTLDPARLARLDEQGRQLDGDRASKTLALHRRIYAADEGEDIEVLEFTLDEALAQIRDGRIIDAKTIMLVQHLRLEMLGES